LKEVDVEKTDDVLHVVGGKPLNGTIKVRGAKNFVSKAMVAALLAPGTSVLKNVPEIRDVHVVSDLLRLHGVNVDVNGDEGIVTIDAKNVQLADVADVDTLSGSSRIPILFSGPLLHRLGEAFIPALGGCNIGGRPIDFHLETLRKLGATVDKEHKDGIHITAPNGLHAADIHLPYPSVGATEQVLLTAVRAIGRTTLRGAAIEPEIMDLIADPAEDGRDHLGADRPGHPHRGRRPARRASTTSRSPTASRPAPGPARRWPPVVTSTSAAPSSCR
jgi:UDP-N-acetylglucosamine 1-carboxyvinyltransferase